MSNLGVHFAIEKATVDRLLAVAGDDDALVELVHEIEEAWDDEHTVAVDKAWDALWRVLSDGQLTDQKARTPLELAYGGARFLNTREDYLVTLLTPAQVASFAEALPPLTEEWMRARYDALPAEYQKSDDDFDYTWANFEDLRNFFLVAAKNQRSVIFTVDQ